MTQLERYAQMMKVHIENVRAHVALHVAVEGSVLKQTIQARAEKIEVHYDVESSDDPARIAALMRNARNGCFVRQTIGRPEVFDDSISLNGAPFHLEDYPPPR